MTIEIICPRCGSTHQSWYAGKMRCHCGQTWVWNTDAQDYLPESKKRDEGEPCRACRGTERDADGRPCVSCGGTGWAT